MNYRIYKLVDDGRVHTCGFLIPDGGYYWVMSLTFENHGQLSNLCEVPNYSVDQCTGELGFFDSQGHKVDPHSVEHNATCHLDRPPKGKVEIERSQKRYVHRSNERKQIVEMCRQAGIGAEGWASTKKMRFLLSLQYQGRLFAAQKSVVVSEGDSAQ